jgi:hypothetical protein
MCMICVFFIDGLGNTDVEIDTLRIYSLWYKQFMLCTTLSEWSLGFRFLETIAVSISELPESSGPPNSQSRTGPPNSQGRSWVHLKCFFISIVVMLWVLICFGSGHKNACIVAMLCRD